MIHINEITQLPVTQLTHLKHRTPGATHFTLSFPFLLHPSVEPIFVIRDTIER